ncbi:MAG TPA: adenylate/guanylate cyclase domain-containing protein [Candidatus Limnocylindrales bacterium]|jgi:class 3 adenylate cyclase
MGTLKKKNLAAPDRRLAVAGIDAEVVEMGDAAISRTVLQHGAHCALGTDWRTGDPLCQAHHAGVILSGRMQVQADDGSSMEAGPGDVVDVAPGHDGVVTSVEPLVMINWSGVNSWVPPAEAGERVVLTLLFTDIVGSTEMAVELGDAVWRDRLARHNQVVRAVLDRYRGREVTTTGDGFLATFEGAARAVHAAIEIRTRTADMGLSVRAGLHTGEVELIDGDVRGVAVHEAARIAAASGPGEILVSSMTYQLASGSDVAFEPRGERELKGLTGARMVYAVV